MLCWWSSAMCELCAHVCQACYNVSVCTYSGWPFIPNTHNINDSYPHRYRPSYQRVDIMNCHYCCLVHNMAISILLWLFGTSKDEKQVSFFSPCPFASRSKGHNWPERRFVSPLGDKRHKVPLCACEVLAFITWLWGHYLPGPTRADLGQRCRVKTEPRSCHPVTKVLICWTPH